MAGRSRLGFSSGLCRYVWHSQNGAAVRLVRFEAKMTNLSKCRSNLAKISINYSCHGRYKGIHIVFSLFSLHSS